MVWWRWLGLWLVVSVVPASCTVVAQGHLDDLAPLSGGGAGGGGDDADGGSVEAPKQSIGTPCTENDVCASGSCTDGVCCDQACVGGCVSCDQLNLYGICTPLTGLLGDCEPGQLCGADGQCTVVDGGSCSDDGDCPNTGFCQDGVCCNERCDGNCESCVMAETALPDGICVGITGTAPECPGDVCIAKGQCCGDGLAAPGGACPEACTGGCAGGTCTILCDDEDECKGMNVVCPADFDCVVSCVGIHSCRDADIDCPPDHRCDVTCDGAAEHPCENTKLTCTNGPCSLACLPGIDPCKGNVEVLCGTNACDITCDADKPKVVTCGTSCQCEPCGPM